MLKRTRFLSTLCLCTLICTSTVFAAAEDPLTQAEAARSSGDTTTARVLYEQAIAASPDDDRALLAHERLACLYIETSDIDEANAALDNIQSKFRGHKDLPRAVTHLADTFRNTSDNARAHDIYNHVIAKWPSAEHALWSRMGLAIASISMRDENAADIAVEAIKTHHQDSQHFNRTLCHIADHYRNRNNHKKARTLYADAIDAIDASQSSDFAVWSRMGMAISAL